jgi:ornithine decarboxylase
MDTSDVFDVDVSDKLQIVDSSNDKKPVVHMMNTDDIYDIISFFLGIKNNDEPFYIVNLTEVQYWYKQFITKLPKVHPYYAIKSNPDPMIVDVLAKLGCGFDCASKDEIIMAKNTGINNDLILYANPTKDIESLQFARLRDVDYLTFDSQSELDKIKVFHPDAKCIIRIRVDDSGAECKLGDKFGCSDNQHPDDEESIESLLNTAKVRKIDVVGVSFHIGSNSKGLGSFTKALKVAKDAYLMGKNCGFDMKIIDLGGGFVPNEDPNNGSTFEQVTQEINKAIDTYFGDIEDIRFIAEPGRLFCTTSHTLVTTVIGIKTTVDKDTKTRSYKYTINESIYGSFNCILFDHAHPKILPFNERNEKTYKSVVFGRTCDSLDRIADDIHLPKLALGDKLYVENFGAYTVGVQIRFNGFTNPKVHYVIRS